MYFIRTSSTSQAILASKPSYHRGWKLYIGTRVVSWSQRTGGPGTMGRFGGGWEIQFGVRSGGLRQLLTLRSLHIMLFVGYLAFGVQDEKYDNEEKARAKAKPAPPTPEQARAVAVGSTLNLLADAVETTHKLTPQVPSIAAPTSPGEEPLPF
jgi:hypothetical protein